MARALRQAAVIIAAATTLCVAPTSALAIPTIGSTTPTIVSHGGSIAVTGTVAPVLAGETVQVQLRMSGIWTNVGAAAVTDGAGTWSTSITPTHGGSIRAVQTSAGNAASASRTIYVKPVIRFPRFISGAVYPFLTTRVRWRVYPATYVSRTAKIEVYRSRTKISTVRATVRSGVITASVPVPGTGRIRYRLVLPRTSAYLGASNFGLSRSVRGRSVTSSSPYMWRKAMRAGLVARSFHAPSGAAVNARMGDAIIAMHKAYNRPRTTSFSAADFDRLSARIVAPRYNRSGDYIEIDKGRQLLLRVRDGRVRTIIHVSTGATGNTPVGTHKIQWKGLWVPSNYGSLLFRSMAFQGGYAIHGYPSVPTTPASHGCVRVPMWIADWLYDRTPVNQPVYVYEGPGGTSARSRSTSSDVPELAEVDVAKWANER